MLATCRHLHRSPLLQQLQRPLAPRALVYTLQNAKSRASRFLRQLEPAIVTLHNRQNVKALSVSSGAKKHEVG